MSSKKVIPAVSFTAQQVGGSASAPNVIEGSYTLSPRQDTDPGPITVSLVGTICACLKGGPGPGSSSIEQFNYLATEGISCHLLELKFLELDQVVAEVQEPSSNTHRWPFRFVLANRTSVDWQKYISVFHRSTIPWPPSKRFAVKVDTNEIHNHNIIKYELHVKGPKLKGKFDMLGPTPCRRSHIFRSRHKMSREVQFVGRTAVSDAAANQALQKPYEFTDKRDVFFSWEDFETGRPLSDRSQGFRLETSVQFPRHIRLGSPQPFPIMLERKIPNNLESPNKSLIFPQIEIVNLYLKLVSRIGWLKVAFEPEIVFEKNYSFRHTMDFHPNHEKQNVATVDLGALVRLELPGSVDFRDCVASFVSAIWEQRYTLEFELGTHWNRKEKVLLGTSTSFPGRSCEITVLPLRRDEMGPLSVVQAGDGLPPSYASVVEDGSQQPLFKEKETKG